MNEQISFLVIGFRNVQNICFSKHLKEQNKIISKNVKKNNDEQNKIKKKNINTKTKKMKNNKIKKENYYLQKTKNNRKKNTLIINKTPLYINSH